MSSYSSPCGSTGIGNCERSSTMGPFCSRGAVDGFDAPAFLIDRDGKPLLASAAGGVLFDRSSKGLRAELRDAIAGGPSVVARTLGAGKSECFLVILRKPAEARRARLALHVGRWGLTPRERDVLSIVVDGDANKEIAIKLGLHEGSVERHVTSLLRKARCDSRSRLVARFWTGQ